MAKKRVIIIGAGLSGLSAAWHLEKKGIDTVVFEKESEIGGLCRSKNINGFIFDYDGHLLHFRHRYTFDLVSSLLKNNLVEHHRNAWVYSQNTFTHYPFQGNFYGLPTAIAKECLLGFIEASKNGHASKENLNFLDWINQTFGNGIARHFMIPYNTKFWTVPPQQLTCEWFDGFIPVPSLSQVIEGTVKENKKAYGYNAKFWYPKKGGISELALAFAKQVKNIYTNCAVTEINLDKKEIKTAKGYKEKFDYLISTVPLPELPRMIKDMPGEIIEKCKRLRWNSIFNLNLGMDSNDVQNKHWIYFPEKDISFFRVGFFHNFSKNLTPDNRGSLYAEVSYSKDNPIDKKSLALHIKEDLIKLNILRQQNNNIYVQDTNDIKYGYPIYDSSYKTSREKILRYLLRNKIFSCGRYGTWRYMTMEEALLDGNRAANIFFKIK
jgi:protoporphyrinogen oxidase